MYKLLILGAAFSAIAAYFVIVAMVASRFNAFPPAYVDVIVVVSLLLIATFSVTPRLTADEKERIGRSVEQNHGATVAFFVLVIIAPIITWFVLPLLPDHGWWEFAKRVGPLVMVGLIGGAYRDATRSENSTSKKVVIDGTVRE